MSIKTSKSYVVNKPDDDGDIEVEQDRWGSCSDSVYLSKQDLLDMLKLFESKEGGN